MTEPFLGEIQIFGFDFNPSGWAFCSGALLPIQQNTALYSLLGVQYGGDGRTTFQLPNLAARAACSQGSGPGLTPRTMGDTFGLTSVALTEQQMPAHQHGLTAYLQSDATKRTGVPVNGGGLSQPSTNVVKPFIAATPSTPTTLMSPSMLKPSTGTAQAHANQQPYLAVNFCIALQGVFPAFG